MWSIKILFGSWPAVSKSLVLLTCRFGSCALRAMQAEVPAESSSRSQLHLNAKCRVMAKADAFKCPHRALLQSHTWPRTSFGKSLRKGFCDPVQQLQSSDNPLVVHRMWSEKTPNRLSRVRRLSFPLVQFVCCPCPLRSNAQSATLMPIAGSKMAIAWNRVALALETSSATS